MDPFNLLDSVRPDGKSLLDQLHQRLDHRGIAWSVQTCHDLRCYEFKFNWEAGGMRWGSVQRISQDAIVDVRSDTVLERIVLDAVYTVIRKCERTREVETCLWRQYRNPFDFIRQHERWFWWSKLVHMDRTRTGLLMYKVASVNLQLDPRDFEIHESLVKVVMDHAPVVRDMRSVVNYRTC